MSPTSVAAWLGGGTGLAALITALVLLVKARPENRLKNAEAAQVIQDASADWVKGVREDMSALRGRITELETAQRAQEARDAAQATRLRFHERWDRNIAEQVRELGGHVSDPPPLYPDPTAA
jgi:hypothetical protein